EPPNSDDIHPPTVQAEDQLDKPAEEPSANCATFLLGWTMEGRGSSGLSWRSSRKRGSGVVAMAGKKRTPGSMIPGSIPQRGG
nr:hypothetical protein [Tanacetum cinerariifolium]